MHVTDANFHGRLMAHFSYHKERQQLACEFCREDQRMNTDDFVQYVITFNTPAFPHQYALLSVSNGVAKLRAIAVHDKIDAIRVAIPPSHVRAPHPQDAPIVEVWIDKRIETAS